MSSSPSFLDPVVLPLLRGEEILDVACGWGRWGCLMVNNYFEWGQSKPPSVDGIDGCPENVVRCQKLGVYRSVRQAMLPCDLGNKTHDTVLAGEIVEHLRTESLEEFFQQIERAARRRVIITTPAWPYFRKGDAFNALDDHLSYVSQKELRRRGYRIAGAGFGNPRNLFCRILDKTNKTLGRPLKSYDALISLSHLFPGTAHTTVAFKDLG